MLITDNSLREALHLFVLRNLSNRWTGRFWAVKGGCAMRLFHRSDRYSVDLDVDAPGFSLAALKAGAAAALEETGRLVRERGWGRIENVTFAKEGENVLRIKLALVTEAGTRLPTKIELSRRSAPLKQFGIVAKPGLDSLQMLGITAFLLPTYSRDGMIVLKVSALLGRSAFAVRDVYDLGHLMTGALPAKEFRALKIGADKLRHAADLVLGNDAVWEKYLSDVHPYLAGANHDARSWDVERMRLSEIFAQWAEKIDEA